MSATWNERPITGDFVTRPVGGEPGSPGSFRWTRIRSVDRMPPFLTTLASGSDHWGFLSSHGSLTAGVTDDVSPRAETSR